MASVKRKNGTTVQHKKTVLEQLRKTHGIIATACVHANVGRQTFYRWLAEDEQFKSDVEDVIEITTDKVEAKLLEQVNRGNLTAIIFYLKCKGKKRGWVERQEVEHTGPRPIVVSPQWKTLFDGEED
ncbi:MAG: hypothetical protein FWC43_07905 [Planctomycetaceae bacterium]|nr:hypothetical protein [Planctomycetaceae bacterium]